MTEETLNFLEKWQELIGSALGPFLAIIFSVIGFWIKSRWTDKKEYKESLRRIEIGITRSLDDAYKTKKKLERFIDKIQDLAKRVRHASNNNAASLDTINFPAMREVFRDINFPDFKIKSYYLHNKILWVDSGIKELNETLKEMKNNFSEMTKLNEFRINLEVQNKTLNPSQQREDYAANLERFAEAVQEFIDQFISKGIEIMIQIKIYNEELRKRYWKGALFLWKNEGTKFKYFPNKEKQKQFARNLDSMERIDKIIQERVESMKEELKKR